MNDILHKYLLKNTKWIIYVRTSLAATMVRHVKRKALQIHDLYVVIKVTQNLLHSLYAVVTLHGGIGRPPVWKTGGTHSFHSYLLKESH
jgi:hypothetical protein